MTLLPVLEPGELKRKWSSRLLELGEVEERVREILQQVKEQGQEAVKRFTLELDGVDLDECGFKVKKGEIASAYEAVSPALLEALREAKENIFQYHLKEKQVSWMETDKKGNVLGQIHLPLKRVGIYAPGGTAPYPSSVLMTGVPALVAGVRELVLATPPAKDGTLNPLLLVAAAELGIKEIYKMGGAQAIAALAYGTQEVKPVEKIAGPGNIYVTIAKREVFGVVDIDMLAGPSEIVVVADASAQPRWVAADLLSQAEHDPLAGAVLITPEESLALRTAEEVERQLNTLPRKKIALKSLENYGAAVVVKDVEEALDLANELAPEHLELCLAEPWRWLGRVENAGAVFLGHYSSEPVGDYWAGPSHVLPTGGTARFSSPMSVATFTKRMSLIYTSPQYLQEVGKKIALLARAEGLEAHARAIEARFKGGK
ncbi:MAG TPA: histidinol dehydrogenase [Moorella mulderi]|nr:histidinol dehydrogenase [Moorella mulderi]